MGTNVELFEVSLRDGLQNEKKVISTDDKLRHLEALLEAGLKDIEVTSFVRPSRIPQLADAAELCARLPKRDDVRFWGLVPNRKGMERALDAGLDHLCTVVSASDTHNRKNLNRTSRETLAANREIFQTVRAEGGQARAYLSTAFGCPYEGDVPPERVGELAGELYQAGAHFVALGDTIGSGSPELMQRVLSEVYAAGVPAEALAVHVHDTQGTALLNVYTAYQLDVRRFDGSVAGVGGCPYAPGAAGNLASERIVHLFEQMGVETGVDLRGLANAGSQLATLLGKTSGGPSALIAQLKGLHVRSA